MIQKIYKGNQRSFSTMMKAIVCDGHGGPEVLKVKEQYIPRIVPANCEVLIKVEATALNRADLM